MIAQDCLRIVFIFFGVMRVSNIFLITNKGELSHKIFSPITVSQGKEMCMQGHPYHQTTVTSIASERFGSPLDGKAVPEHMHLDMNIRQCTVNAMSSPLRHKLQNMAFHRREED